MQIDLSIFSTKARPLIGLDISSSAVKLVELSGGGKEGYRVERYTIEVLAKDVVADGNIVNLEAAAEAVKTAIFAELDKVVPYLTENELVARGGKYSKHEDPWAAYVVSDDSNMLTLATAECFGDAMNGPARDRVIAQTARERDFIAAHMAAASLTLSGL